jgi:Caspase domain
MKRYFSDFFEVLPETLEDYGAFNISLVADLPLFIDPFLLFNSHKEEYRKLHDNIIRYLMFLKEKSVAHHIDNGLIKSWYRFPEVKQNWLGFSATGNKGSGLGSKFATALHSNLKNIFRHFGKESVTHGSHLEKLCLISGGVGRDNISDFTTNLIKEFLLDYTQEFARMYINKKFRKEVGVAKVRFNFETESWEHGRYDLPFHAGDYVILTPVDMLTRDDTWINRAELVNGFERIPASIPDDQLRARINNYFNKLLPNVDDEKQKKKHKQEAATKTILNFPEIIDFYIRFKEENGDEAENASSSKVAESKRLYLEQFSQLGESLARTTDFYKITGDTYQESFERVMLFKDAIENKDGYKVLYFDDKPIEREDDLKILYRLTWRATPNLANNMADEHILQGAKTSNRGKYKSVIEMKLASNAQLKRRLEKEVEDYEDESGTPKSIIVIVYFSWEELDWVHSVLNELKINDHKNILLIDARKDNKYSSDAINLNIDSGSPQLRDVSSSAELVSESSSTASNNFSNGYALVIGVGDDLPVTLQDATALYDVLVDPSRAAYPHEQVQLLIDQDAHRLNVLDAFDRLIEQSNKNPNATVVIYYSGHGGRIKRQDQTTEYFLIPYGYEHSRLAETTISGREFTDKVKAINARTLIVLLDCCHAGGVPALKEPGESFEKAPVPIELIAALETGSGQVVVASSRENEYSYTGNPYSVLLLVYLRP